MFRKIRSNRDPADTVWTELRREFKPYVIRICGCLQTPLIRHPRTVFGLMIVIVVLSAFLSFTVFRHKESPTPVRALAPVSGGIGQIMQAGEALREMLQLKKAIDSLSAKKQLAPADSVFLDSALTRFNQLNKKFNQRK